MPDGLLDGRPMAGGPLGRPPLPPLLYTQDQSPSLHPRVEPRVEPEGVEND